MRTNHNASGKPSLEGCVGLKYLLRLVLQATYPWVCGILTSKINEAGLGGKVFVKPNNYAGGSYFFGCFFNGNQWVVYENDERGKHEGLIRTLYEEEAFQYLYEYMIGKRR